MFWRRTTADVGWRDRRGQTVRRRLAVEGLESRLAPATFRVNTLLDTVAVDLRTGRVTIRGAGAGATVVNANGIDRVFHALGGLIEVSGLTIQGGAARDGAG